MALPKSGSKDSTANLGFEAKLWFAADKLRNNMDPADYNLALQTALRDSASSQSEVSPQVVSKAKDNMAGVDFACLRSASSVLANGSMSYNGPARATSFGK